MERDLFRAKIICCHFATNLAYFHAGEGHEHLLSGSNFWRLANGNFAEIAIMEFCKLFGGPQERHRWQNIIHDQGAFIADLEGFTGLSLDDFKEYVKGVREYRDKYLSHLDAVDDIQIPLLSLANTGVSIYYEHIIRIESTGSFPASLSDVYTRALQEATACYPAQP